MSPPESSRDEALKRLDERVAALEARMAPPPRDYGATAAGYGSRLVGLLIGGAFVGVGLGWVVDLVLHTRPFGMIVGVLAGFVVSIWLAVRTAQKMTAEAAGEWGPIRDLPPEDDERD